MNSKMAGYLVFGLTAVSLTSVYMGCSHFAKNRAPAYAEHGTASAPVPKEIHEVHEQDALIFGGTVHYPEGLTRDEALELWHLGEGSEVYPMAWLVRMKSRLSNLKDKTTLNEDLDKKFGVIAVPGKFLQYSPFPLKWIGMTAAWSGEHPTQADVRISPGQNIESVLGVRELPNRNKSIAMVGVNCAFCHSSAIQVGTKSRFVEGAPNMLAIRNFFQDMYASTAKTMLFPDLLAEFLRASNVKGDVDTIALNFSEEMKADLGLSSWVQNVVGKGINFLDSEYYEQKKTKKLRQTMFEKRPVMKAYLIRLLKLTYGIESISRELDLRMEFLANSIGLDPNLPTTPEGFARTDAFGRIANLVARFKDPIPLTATTSLPPMWNIKYRALFHWNGNTNSVVMRNMGQSFGLGALMTNREAKDNSQYDATTNLHNLQRLESLLYKLQSPRWDDWDEPLDLASVQRGCDIFMKDKSCATCHMPHRERVGPTKELVLHRMISQREVGTDETYSKLQATPVDGVPFKDALFGFTGKVRDRYYERYHVTEEQKAEWERRSLRGEEIFRDTVLGESSHSGDSAYMNVPASPKPGFPARQLGSVWATAPYLHNGSVPNLYELLKPAAQREKMFFVGSRTYDTKHLGFMSDFSTIPQIPNLEEKAQALLNKKVGWISWVLGKVPPAPKNILEAKYQVACNMYPERCFDTSQVGNSNKGHEGPMFGTGLSEQQKYDLIEFMKVLRPEPEYSRNAAPIYRFDGHSCQIL